MVRCSSLGIATLWQIIIKRLSMLCRQFSFFIIKSHSLYFISTPRRQLKAKPTTKSKANSSKNHLGQAKAQLLSGQLQRVPEMKDESNRPRRPMRTNSKNSRLLWNTSKKSRALGLAAIQLICAAAHCHLSLVSHQVKQKSG